MTTSTAFTRITRNETDDGAVWRVELAAAPANVLDLAMIEQLSELFREAAAAASLKAVVISGQGEHFSYGASVPEHAPDTVREMLSALHGAARALLETDVPLIACVRGACLGGGLELAILADRLFATPDAKFGQPELSLGVFAPIGSALLPRIIGARQAADLLLTGRTISATEAHALGLVHELTDDPGAAALSWAREHLSTKSASSLRLATRAARRVWLGPFLEDLAALEELYLSDLCGSHDGNEGISAFLEKRTPRWEHR